ncbi:MAG: hypothetical protein GTN49_09760 [candidate division Zixibacteria bacterium]|nr:hypothetical protein [candidate division Zixibacteria bacterium]
MRAGRKFGKTYVAVRVARDWAADADPGAYVLVAAPEYAYLRDQLVPEMIRAVPSEALRGSGWGNAYNKTEHILTLANDAKIILRSMDNADAVRPLSVAGLVAEEFSLWSRYAWEECVRPTLMAKDAPALFIFTPKGLNQAHELWARAAAAEPGYVGFHFTSYDGILPAAGIDAEARGLPENVYRQEILAEFLGDLGGVFRGVRACVAGDLEEPQPDETYVVGCDLGKTTDFTVICVLKRSSRALVHFERFNQLDWEFQVAKVRAASSRYHDATVWLDSTGLGDPVYDRLRSLGVPARGYKFTAETKRRLVENLALAIGERTVRFPDVPALLSELEIYAAEQLPGGGVRYGAPAGYHDDAVTALALACWGLGRGGSSALPTADGGRVYQSRGFDHAAE